MKILKNPEIKKELIIYGCLIAAVSAAGVIINLYCGAGVLAAGVIFLAVHIYFTWKRYDRINMLSRELDRLLHGQQTVLISDSDEGEMAVLKSEIGKMTVRLKEQSEQLLADKQNLSRAMEDIFHQLRTPLTAMNLNVELMKNSDLSYEKRLGLARTLAVQLERMQWLVETLLKMSQIDADVIHFRKDDISSMDLINKSAEPFLIPAELKGVSVEANTDSGHITGDEKWLCEALGNLIKNALEHTPKNGAIIIDSSENALFTEIRIRDTGEGFAEEDIPHLFKRFYKGRNASPGSIGIGLAFSRLIIAAQGGVITAHNAAGGGAEFIIKFYKSNI